jgi:Tfp pilus assembly protein FimV
MKEIEMHVQTVCKRMALATAVVFCALQVQAAEPVTQAKTYIVKPGDTLDKVVRTQLADSPLRADLLKEALVSQNPGAFVKGSNKVLLSGASLQLPNHEAILRKHLNTPSTSPESTSAPDHSQARRHWVRYP